MFKKIARRVLRFSSRRRSINYLRSHMLFEDKTQVTMVVYFRAQKQASSIPGIAILFDRLSGQCMTVPLSHPKKGMRTNSSTREERGPPTIAPVFAQMRT